MRCVEKDSRIEISSFLNLHHAPPSMKRFQLGHGYRNIFGGGVLFVFQIQWAAAAREQRYSSRRSLSKELRYSDQDEASGGTKRLSWKKGNASIVAEWRSTSPLGKHFPPWLIATESLPVMQLQVRNVTFWKRKYEYFSLFCRSDLMLLDVMYYSGSSRTLSASYHHHPSPLVLAKAAAAFSVFTCLLRLGWCYI